MEYNIWGIIIIIFVSFHAICDPVDPDDFPSEVRSAWSNVNSLRELPQSNISYYASAATTILDSNNIQKSISFVCDSLYDNSMAMETFIQSIASEPQDTISLFFPEGVYTFNKPINFLFKSNIILKGSGDRKTQFHFDITDDLGDEDVDKHCITIINSENIGIENICIYRTDNWYENSAMDSLEIDNLIDTYSLGGEYEPIKSMIENHYKPRNVHHSGKGNNIHINKSNRCWIVGVESFFAVRFNIMIENHSFDNFVYGCYIRDPLSFGVGGQGYGFVINYQTSNSLIENNIISYCRHAFGLESEARNNVIAYNY